MRIRLLRNVVLADGPVRRWLRAGKVFEWPDAGAQALIADGAAEAMEPLPAPEVSAETVDVGTPITDEEAAALPDAEIEVVESASSDSTDGAAEAMEPLPAPEVSAETVDVGTPITDEEAAALPDAEIEVVESASSDSTAGAQEDEPPAPKKGRKG